MGVLLHTRSRHLPPFTRHVLGNLQAEAQRGLGTCVVSQVVADSLARLPLEGCRVTRRVHGGKWRERV